MSLLLVSRCAVDCPARAAPGAARHNNDVPLDIDVFQSDWLSTCADEPAACAAVASARPADKMGEFLLGIASTGIRWSAVEVAP